jgi:predicted amidohydrolase
LKGKKANLWVLPELALSGYEFLDKAELQRYAEEIPDGSSVTWLCALAAEQSAVMVMGLAELADDCVYNTAVMVGAEGVIGKYRKLHLFDREKELFQPGNQEMQIYDVAGVKIGMMICFDWIFPEVARTLALRGAQILCHPSNLVLPYCQKAMFARSVENGVFTITANRIGIEERVGRQFAFSGNSQILNPQGEILAQAGNETVEVTVVEIEPKAALNKMITPANHLLRDRRPEIYGLE